MKKITVVETKDPMAPAIIRVENRETKVWDQALWTTGEYARYIQQNGCGHCCCAMAANLHGVSMNPHEEYTLCRRLWGEPKTPQGNYLSVSGIVKILCHLEISAACFGVRQDTPQKILDALRQDKQVIFWAHPQENFPDNPFSTGEHYVMAVGLLEDRQILIANSSSKVNPAGVQRVSLQDVCRALYPNAEPKNATWGEDDDFPGCAGYVIVG